MDATLSSVDSADPYKRFRMKLLDNSNHCPIMRDKLYQQSDLQVPVIISLPNDTRKCIKILLLLM